MDRWVPPPTYEGGKWTDEGSFDITVHMQLEQPIISRKLEAKT